MIKSILPAAILLALAGCATPYQPNNIGLMGGYYQAPMSQNSYIVGFSGNEFTTSTRAYDFAVLRAASIGESLGYNYFTINSCKPTAETPAFPGYIIGVTYYNTPKAGGAAVYYSTAGTITMIETKYST